MKDKLMVQYKKILNHKLNVFFNEAFKFNLQLPTEIWGLIRGFLHASIARKLTLQEIDSIVNQLDFAIRYDLKFRLEKVNIISYEIEEFSKNFVKMTELFMVSTDDYKLCEKSSHKELIDKILLDSLDEDAFSWLDLYHRKRITNGKTPGFFMKLRPLGEYTINTNVIMYLRTVQKKKISPAALKSLTKKSGIKDLDLLLKKSGFH